jgi:hypothetical protein
MPEAERLIYHSPNGDAWYLVRASTGHVYVRHDPNRPSGGKPGRMPLGAFLEQGGGPEQQELMRLIGTLADGAASQGQHGLHAISPEDEVRGGHEAPDAAAR